MFKKMVMVLMVLALTLGLSGIAMAGEKVDALSATATGLDWVSNLVSRLIESGEPAVVFEEQTKAAVKVTLVEGFVLEHLNIIGGATLVNDEAANFVWGIEYTGWTEKSEGIWNIFSQLKPGIYNEKGEWFLGVAYAWRD